jgi:hypothetical protein
MALANPSILFSGTPKYPTNLSPQTSNAVPERGHEVPSVGVLAVHVHSRPQSYRHDSPHVRSDGSHYHYGVAFPAGISVSDYLWLLETWIPLS